MLQCNSLICVRLRLRNTTTSPLVGWRCLQFLFVDEFQYTGNEVYTIIEKLRKLALTKMYCFGDPNSISKTLIQPYALLAIFPP